MLSTDVTWYYLTLRTIPSTYIVLLDDWTHDLASLNINHTCYCGKSFRVLPLVEYVSCILCRGSSPSSLSSSLLICVPGGCPILLLWIVRTHFTSWPEPAASNQNSKTATIEMYAPSSYNDTVTGETLSSVSEKSDSYSNEGSQPDYMVSTLTIQKISFPRLFSL